MLHSQETGVTQSGQLLHAFFQRIDNLILLKFLVLIDHLLIEHKHRHFLDGGSKTNMALTLALSSGKSLLKSKLHTYLFGGLLGAVVDPPAQARTPAGNMSSNLELPRHWVAHDSTGDISRHLGDGAF